MVNQDSEETFECLHVDTRPQKGNGLSALGAHHVVARPSITSDALECPLDSEQPWGTAVAVDDFEHSPRLAAGRPSEFMVRWYVNHTPYTIRTFVQMQVESARERPRRVPPRSAT